LWDLERSFPHELAVIGVHSAKFTAEKDPENVAAAIARNGVVHPVVSDPDFVIWQAYSVRAWPTLMFIDPQGKVIGRHEGEFPRGALHEIVEEMIEEFDGLGLLDRSPIVHHPLPAANGGVFSFPGKVLADATTDRLYIADTGHHRIVIVETDGRIERTIGSGEQGLEDGDGSTARFNRPQGLAIDAGERVLYVADAGSHALRAVDLESGEVRTVAGTGERSPLSAGGPGRDIALASPWDLAWRDGDRRLWIAMAGMHQLWTFDPESEEVRPAAGTGVESLHDGPLEEATFSQPMGLTSFDGVLYSADSESSSIRRIDPGEDRVRRLIGRGLFEFGDIDARGDSARLQHPQGVAAVAEGEGAAVYIADSYNDKIKRLDPSTREVTTVAGGFDRGHVDGAATEAEFWEPAGISVLGRTAYIADTNNHAIRTLDLNTGVVATLPIETADC
jgi:DNA-binding beta-propeller fold protein YncE